MELEEYKVQWLIQAAEDLQNIRRYLDQEAPDQAQDIISQIYNEAESLNNFPNRGQREPDRPDHRRLVVLKIYKVIYKIIGKRVEIRHIRHTSQDNTDIYKDQS